MRLDVDGDEGYTIPADNPFVDEADIRGEIWAYGLANAWRFSFDRATGDLYIADTGENRYEEINFAPADDAGGHNYGWNLFEGTRPYQLVGDAPETTDPVLTYSQSFGRCVIVGGVVYRGDAIPELQGAYLYADYCTGEVWAATRNDDGTWQSTELIDTDYFISSFGEDADGEVYLVGHWGRVVKLVPGA